MPKPMTEYEQFVAELEADEKRQAAAILSYQKQMREQRKPLVNVWVAIGAVVLLLCAMWWIFERIADAVGL